MTHYDNSSEDSQSSSSSGKESAAAHDREIPLQEENVVNSPHSNVLESSDGDLMKAVSLPNLKTFTFSDQERQLNTTSQL